MFGARGILYIMVDQNGKKQEVEYTYWDKKKMSENEF